MTSQNNTIKMMIKTRGDYITPPTKPILFTVDMVNPSIQVTSGSAKPIYFVPTIKLTNKLIKDADLGISTEEIFSSPSSFTELIKYATRAESGFKPITLQQAMQQGILLDNIDFLKKLYFPYKGKFYINGKVYTIRDSKIVKGTIKSPPDSNIQGPYSVEIELALVDGGKSTGYIGMKREKCKDQAVILDKQAKALFNINLGLSKPTSSGPTMKKAPVMYTSSKTGVASKKPTPKRSTALRSFPYYNYPGLSKNYPGMSTRYPIMPYNYNNMRQPLKSSSSSLNKNPTSQANKSRQLVRQTSAPFGGKKRKTRRVKHKLNQIKRKLNKTRKSNKSHKTKK